MNSNYAAALAAVTVIVVFVFRRKIRVWLAKHGVHRTNALFGGGLMAVQSIVQPRVEHVLRVRQEEKTEHDDAGDPPDLRAARRFPRKPS